MQPNMLMFLYYCRLDKQMYTKDTTHLTNITRLSSKSVNIHKHNMTLSPRALNNTTKHTEVGHK